jgi:hypothetical protein
MFPRAGRRHPERSRNLEVSVGKSRELALSLITANSPIHLVDLFGQNSFSQVNVSHANNHGVIHSHFVIHDLT